jgi:hypothetical protein
MGDQSPDISFDIYDDDGFDGMYVDWKPFFEENKDVFDRFKARMDADPLKRIRRDKLCKAFTIWHKRYPLVLKCDELARQMQERLMALNKVRDSYLRDVISVKQHVSKLARFDSNKESEARAAQEAMREIMPELAAVPSPDLRELIECAKSSLKPSSSSLKEAMINAGLVDPSTGQQLSPWEQGKAFAKGQRNLKGKMYNPHSGGATISLHSPASHKLYVNYCKECVGVMSMVALWNSEVERAVQHLNNGDRMVIEMENMKRSVAAIQQVVLQQEIENQRLVERNVALEARSEWMDHWQAGLDAEADKVSYTDQLLKHRELAAMSQEETKSIRFNMFDRARIVLDIEKRRVAALQVDLRDETQIREREEVLRAKAEEELKILKDTVATNKETISVLEEKLASTSDFLVKTQGKYETAVQYGKKMDAELAQEQKEREDYRMITESTVNELKAEIVECNSEYELKEVEVDQLRDVLRARDGTIADLLFKYAEPTAEEVEVQVRATVQMLPRHVRRAVDDSIIADCVSGKIEFANVHQETIVALARSI